MKGLLFTPEMALAACRAVDPKTNTRRVIVPQPFPCKVAGIPMWGMKDGPIGQYCFEGTIAEDKVCQFCDYKVGERRCLLTTWAVVPRLDNTLPTEIPLSDAEKIFWHAGMGERPPWASKFRPGRFLPNRLRPLLPVFEIVSVRAERVQDISYGDIIAEGCRYPVSAESRAPLLRITGKFPPYQYSEKNVADWSETDWLRTHWASLWDSINAKRGFGWSVNPWVWAITFKRIP